ncbi:MAG: DUF2895 family protein [Parahaliea sp.]
MSRYDSLVHSKDAMIRLLLGVLAILSLLLLVALVGWSRAPDNIRLHYPPCMDSSSFASTLSDCVKVRLPTCIRSH